MMNAATPWEVLFPRPRDTERVLALHFRLVRKHGQPLLLVPTERRAVGEALSLYPAQTPKARVGRTILGVLLQAGLGLGTAPVTICVDPQSGLWAFLRSDSPHPEELRFAMLFGNPHVPGRRFILLVFDAFGRPVKLVKAGGGERAIALIRAEATFLKSVPAELSCAPRVLSEFSEGDVAALALEYVAGSTPDLNKPGFLEPLLSSWLDRRRTIPISNLPAWQRLAVAAKAHPLFPRVESALGSANVHPALFHGDFAPWNVRVDPVTRRWRVIDWERGELAGPPGWDWFHYVIQVETLVRRAGPEAILTRVEQLLNSAEFQRYAGLAGAANCARTLLLAYLLYCVEVMPPAEGAQTGRELLAAFEQRWPKQ